MTPEQNEKKYGLAIARKYKPTYALDYLQPMTFEQCKTFRSKMTRQRNEVIHIVEVAAIDDPERDRNWFPVNPLPAWLDL